MQTWLAVESLSSWTTDEKNGFRYLGISDTRVERAKGVKAGDILFIYIPSPVRAFADIRLITKDGVGKNDHLRAYDVVCYTGIFTKPLVSIERPNWLPITSVKDHLTIGRLPAAGMRVSFRQIPAADGQTISAFFKNLSPSVDLRPVEKLYSIVHR